MPRITITFPKDVFNKLQENATQKEIKIAHYVRNLTDIGLRVEVAAAKQENIKGDRAELSDSKSLYENNLSWLLESLYLIRYLIRCLAVDENLLAEDSQSYSNDVIVKAKEKAQSYVDKLLEKKVAEA